MPDQGPHEAGIERGDKQEDVGRGVEDALGLGVALPAFEENKGRDAKDHDPQVKPCQLCQLTIREDGCEHIAGLPPQRHERGSAEQYEVHHTLRVDANQVLVAGPKSLACQRVEAVRKALDNGVAYHVGRDAGH